MSFRAATALGTSLVGLIPMAAHAAPAASYDWSGTYAGATAGLVRQGAAGTVSYPDSDPADAPDHSFYFNGGGLEFSDTGGEAASLPTMFGLDGSGKVIGLDAGFNRQLGSFVFGIEGDTRLFVGAGNSSTQSSQGADVSVDYNLDDLTTLRARVGIAADRLLLFTTAGLAIGHSTLSTNLDYTSTFNDNGKSAALAGTSSGVQLGYAAGLGAEYAVNDNISLKAEGLYYNLGAATATATNNGSTYTNDAGMTTNPAGASPYSASVKTDGVVLSTGINFRF